MKNAAKVLATLKGAKALLAKPENWTKEFSARNSDGQQVSCRSEEARSWCLLGAVDRANTDAGHSDLIYTQSRDFIIDLLKFNSFLKVLTWNDAPGRTHGEVVRLLNKGIGRLKNEVAS